MATLKKNGIPGSRECAHCEIPSCEGCFAPSGRRAPAVRGARFRLQKRISRIAPIPAGGR